MRKIIIACIVSLMISFSLKAQTGTLHLSESSFVTGAVIAHHYLIIRPAIVNQVLTNIYCMSDYRVGDTWDYKRFDADLQRAIDSKAPFAFEVDCHKAFHSFDIRKTTTLYLCMLPKQRKS